MVPNLAASRRGFTFARASQADLSNELRSSKLRTRAQVGNEDGAEPMCTAQHCGIAQLESEQDCAKNVMLVESVHCTTLDDETSSTGCNI